MLLDYGLNGLVFILEGKWFVENNKVDKEHNSHRLCDLNSIQR